MPSPSLIFKNWNMKRHAHRKRLGHDKSAYVHQKTRITIQITPTKHGINTTKIGATTKHYCISTQNTKQGMHTNKGNQHHTKHKARHHDKT